MYKEFQRMVEVFVRIVFRGVGRQEKHLNFLLAFLQPGFNKFAMMNLQVIFPRFNMILKGCCASFSIRMFPIVLWRSNNRDMEYIDLRKVGKEGLKQIRSQVVRLKEMGKSGKEIEKLVGVRQNRISEIWTAYQREGESSLERKKYGRKPGTHMLLCMPLIFS